MVLGQPRGIDDDDAGRALEGDEDDSPARFDASRDQAGERLGPTCDISPPTASEEAGVSMLHDLVRRPERIEALDRLAGPLARVISPAVRPRAIRNLLSGTYVGHPLHPMLTDLPIGAWGMSTVLDAVGGRCRARRRPAGEGRRRGCGAHGGIGAE